MSIGPEKWAATVSDSTNVTKTAHCEVSATVLTMLDLCNVIHHFQLTIKDISLLSDFTTVS